MSKTKEKPCGSYARGDVCEGGRDHCFNCGRHLETDGETCPAGCGEHGDAWNDDANNTED